MQPENRTGARPSLINLEGQLRSRCRRRKPERVHASDVVEPSAMSIVSRRALTLRNIILFRNSSIRGEDLSPSVSFLINTSVCSNTEQPRILPHTAINFLRDSRRSFAKGRKSRDDSASSTVEVLPDIGPSVKENVKAQSEAALAALSVELSKLRTGRASAGMLDHIIVEVGGLKMPLNQMAVVSVLDSKTLSINPYDPNAIKNLESALVSSPFGLSPRVDSERLIAVIPPLTKEHVQAMCKQVAKSCEDVKQSIRRARQKALESIKKLSSGYSKDDIKRLEKEVDELTKKFIKTAEDTCKAKEKEITGG